MRAVPPAALALALAGLVGCGNADRDDLRVPVYPVEGLLIVSGIPAADAQIAFHPLRPDEQRSVLPTGKTSADGHFHLTTYGTGDGAPAGEYAVTLIWRNDSLPIDECADPATHDRLNGYYTDPTKRRILATVRPGPNPITLRVEVGSSGWTLPRQRVNEGRK